MSLSGSSGSLLGLTFTRDANGRVTAMSDSAAPLRNASYSYSDAGRLATAVGTWGADTYTWDANDNRTRADRVLSGSTTSDVATLTPGTNRLSELRDGAGVLSRSFAYTPAGNTSTVTRAGAPTLGYSYDARGRLISVTSGASTIASYSYDWREQRVAASSAGAGAVHYLYAPDGQLLAEMDAATGTMLREYVWLDTMPLAMVSGAVATPTYLWITTGNLNEPLLLTNAAGQVTASTTRDPWGNPIQLAGGQPLDLGYPGQWKDPSTGLFQNWHRDYDPTLGRYAEADPIGLGGGGNLFAYVGGDPVNLSDLTGLEIYRPRPSDWFTLGPWGPLSWVRDQVVPAMRGARICYDPWEIGKDILIDGGWMLAGLGVYRIGELAFMRGGRPPFRPSIEPPRRNDGIGLGPYAREGVPGQPGRPTSPQQIDINRIGGQHGCHTCGTRDPGTKYGNFVGDHQPANALNSRGEPQYFYPHCLHCSAVQGGKIRQMTKPRS